MVPQSSISDASPVPAQTTQSARPEGPKGAATSLAVSTWLSLVIGVSISLPWFIFTLEI
jgi:hypothetical protein